MIGVDSPNEYVSSTDNSISISDSFDTYLMYVTPTAVTEHQDWIFVPLKKLSWNWSGHAVRRNASGWVATTNIDATNTTSDLVSGTPVKAASGTNTLDYPTWTQKASQGNYVPAR